MTTLQLAHVWTIHHYSCPCKPGLFHLMAEKSYMLRANFELQCTEIDVWQTPMAVKYVFQTKCISVKTG
jgi:hypothetical protein